MTRLFTYSAVHGHSGVVDMFYIPTGLWGPEADVSGRPMTGEERGGGPREQGQAGSCLGNQLSQARACPLWQYAGVGME